VHSTFMETMVWLRVPGDIVFSVGALALAVYALRLLRRPASQAQAELAVPAAARS
jgi:nitric oxide reductase subunit B